MILPNSRRHMYVEHQTLTPLACFWEVTCSSICRIELSLPVRISVALSYLDQYEFVSGSTILTGTNLCGFKPPWPQDSLSSWAILVVQIYVGLRYHDRFESLPSWSILTKYFHGFSKSLKTTARHISNYITTVSFEVLSTSSVIILRIDVSVN